MFRHVFAPFGVAVSLAVAAIAADPPKSKSSGDVQFVIATLKGDQFTYEVTQQVTVTEYVSQQKQVNGKQVTVMVPVSKQVDQKSMFARPMSELKATGTNGKEIPPADLKEKLKAATPVVLLSGPIGEEWRMLFKTGTVFVEPKK
jgi:hypothetical protein